MLPRVTMPRITLGKERQDRDKQHRSLRCSWRKKNPLSGSLEESVQLLQGNNAALSRVYLDSLCLQETEYSSQRFWRLIEPHSLRGAAGPSEHQDLFISAPCNWRHLPAISESFWKAQTTSFFHTLICPFERCDRQRQAHPSLAHFPSPCEDLQQFIPLISTMEQLYNSACLQETCRVIRHIPACWGHPGL